MRRLVLLFTITLCFAGLAGADVASAALGKKTAERAAFKVAKRAALANGAAVWWAGRCKRRSANKFVCWAAIVYENYDGAAQRVLVKRSGGGVRARRYGRVYTGNLRDDAQGRTNGGEWAVCGIRQSVCVGS
jgi:hypothetical protein